jgi:hypothetical protein
MEMHPFYLCIDPFLIWFYRITGVALADFLLGTLALAFIALLIGEFTISLAFLALRRRIDRITGETVRYQNLSIDALAAGDQEAYQAANTLANDAFGQSFFLQIGLSAAFLWPIFFALGWMRYRFAEVDFPLPWVDLSLSYIGVFILLYVAAYFLFKPVKYRIPYFRRIKGILDQGSRQTPAMKTFADLRPPKG